MTDSTWNYCGDVDIWHGGFYWQESGYDDHVYAVEIIPESHIGGRDNVALVQWGSIFIGDDIARHKSALDGCGYPYETATRVQLVESMFAYAGLDDSDTRLIQIGKDPEDMPRDSFGDIDILLHGNTRLKQYVESNYCDSAF